MRVAAPVGKQSPDLVAWAEELAFFDGAKSRLMDDPRYRGRFVAIRGRSIVDDDDDEFRLAKRIYARFPSEVVLIEKVGEDGGVREIPSPEVA